jgi:Major Facilitator Superfamily
LEKRVATARSKAKKIPQSRADITNSAQRFIRTSLTRPLHMLLTEPIAGLFSLYISFNFAIQYSFFVAFPTIFKEQYGLDLRSQGLTFVGLGVGILIAIIAIIINSKYIYAPLAIRWKKQNAQDRGESRTKGAASTPPPEWRLFTAFPGSILIPVSLFLFGWTARPSVHWIVPVIAEALFGIGQVLDFMSCTMYLMDTYGPRYGASAMAANTLLRYTIGFAFPLFVDQMYDKLGIGWATSLLGFISIALTLVPWCFWIWGPKLRGMSKYEHGA